jgi:hypothetical protein
MLERTTPDDYKVWRAHWNAHGQSWRTEPEIDEERQTYLTKGRRI